MVESLIAGGRTRPVLAGLNGAVAAAHPLASQAGLDQLRAGGNAVDAVVAMAAALGVVEPYMSGPGGVGLLLLHLADGETHVLNFTGNTPAAGTPDKFTPQTQDLGPRACLIPGNVAGWFEALAKYGTRSPGDVLAPAVRHAVEGFPLHPMNAHFISTGQPRLNPEGRRIFSKVAAAPAIGSILRQPELGRTYQRLIEFGPEDFYTGDLARNIVEDVQQHDGLLTLDDLASYRPRWEQPLETDWHGVRVRTCPPNCEGFQILQTLGLLQDCDLVARGHNSADYIHLLTEAIKLAAADRIAWCGDPDFVTIPLDQLLSENYLAQRRQLINHTTASRSEGERWRGPREAAVVAPGRFPGLTTHLSAVDRQGNVASITQSLGNGFGSGFYVRETGVLLNNFVWWTEIDPACDTPNLIAPGKRWSCCMSPVQVFHPDGRFWFSIATPGSEGILHTTVQMLLNILVFNADIQSAIEAPRFRVWEGTRLQIEERIPAAIRQELTARGHSLEPVGDWSYYVGGGQAVMIDPASGARLSAADPRRDGYALAWQPASFRQNLQTSASVESATVSAIFQLSVLLQAAGGQGPPGYEYAAESDPLLDGLLAILSGLGSLLYLAFLFWMVFECLRQDPDRWLWVWVMLLLQPVGPFVYFFARWLPGKEVRLPAGLRRFTRGKELSRLEVAARQIGNPHQFVQWADALREVRKYDQAARAYATALEREPDHLQALWGAALVDITQEQYESAEVRLRRVLELDPQYKFGDVSLEFGKVLCRLGRNDEATAHLEQHVNRWRHPEALYRLAELAVARNDSASARRWLQEMLLDIEGSPKGIARKYTMWKSRARRLLRKLPAP